MPVRVFKKSQSTFLASPVALKLTPLTVTAAQSRNIIGDFPDDEISPNRARKIHIFFPITIDIPNTLISCTEEADFNGTVIDIIFPPDESLPRPIFELPADIPIVDDEINEANMQQFIVSLRLISALNTSRVKIEQNTSICNIIDNDCKSKINFHQNDISCH